ncbi:MAG TPA: dihydropyrimidinase [Bacteroidales bacterium]|nr:dihydropyrimidinase [Bacteroidales bacterium]
MDILIKNGTIVTSEKTFPGFLFLSDGKIAACGQEGEGIPDFKQETREIDANGMLVIPGGVDPHVHLQMQTQVGLTGDDFRSGSIAALMGGTTTFMDFATPLPKQPLPDALEKRIDEARESLIDFSLHIRPSGWYEALESELKECMQIGARTIKMNMAYLETIGLRPDSVQKIMHLAAQNNATVALHAELGEEIEQLRSSYFSLGNTAPKYHAISRPVYTETRAVKNLIHMAGDAGCTIYLMHISAGLSLSEITKARNEGMRVYAETCPHYLLLNDSALDDDFEKASRFVLSPPLRKKDDNQALWLGLANGAIQTIATDHCPFQQNQKRLGLNDFRKIPNGAGGIEHRMALLYTYGVLQNRITLNKWVELCSTAGARIFGLYPRKGSLNPGADADVVIWNPTTRQVISAQYHWQRNDNSIYEGMQTTGGPEIVISRGVVVAEKNNLIQPYHQGRFLRQGNIFQSLS